MTKRIWTSTSSLALGLLVGISIHVGITAERAWADDFPNQYAENVVDEEEQLINHIEQQLVQLQNGKRLTGDQTFRPHEKHPAWGRYWLEGLTSLVTSNDVETQKLGVRGFRQFVDNMQDNPIPPAETKIAVDAIKKFAGGDHPNSLKFEANTLAQGLGVLQVANDPKTKARPPGSLPFEQFVIENDQRGRRREFNHTGLDWTQRITGDNIYRFRETRRTPQYIEMYDLTRGIWMRLEPDQAKRSFDYEEWEFIAKGEFTRG
ncbi:hypothetical protein C5Y96_06450 [Blastopirellula marina]|uniref:Uncharacterized protein n=1 Tax=Blastopirellula marina TaxID=124 RepID=A0A2S8FXB9_9BACT|nr:MULTISPECIES: hypothetical protein [Pirellulaceae]PQO36803.1 hypothetical protein C5Y96_06450 [Blastopirellula marina]RCS53518.1 hypothetical protein DTL36_06460 [Bremerella cremea]